MVRASRVVRIRLIATRVLLEHWWARPPRPADVARTIRHATHILREAGPGGLLQSLNAGAHALALEGADTTIWARIRNARNQVQYELTVRYLKWRARVPYWRWRRFERLSRRDARAMRAASARLEYRPLLSILMPVYNTDERWLRAAIESVQRQLYTNWELCIADDHSTDARVGDVLRSIQARDRRVKVVFRPANGHISAASTSALALASGEFIALLDHDDVLPRHALAAVVHELNRHPDADIVYSDEDRLDEAGWRFAPYFKPDWNPELFYGQNLISHLGVYRKALVERVGGFREGFEGSQDYDLALRVLEQTEPRKIRHIPHILYHWRAVPGSAARGVDEKGYAYGAARRAVAEHFERIHLQATCEPAPDYPHQQRIRYTLPDPRPHVTLIIPTRDRIDHLSRCVASVTGRSTYEAFDIVIVDNGSSQEASRFYFEQVVQDPRISILRIDEPFNFSRLNNLAAAQARGTLLCFLNNDTAVISPDWLEELVSIASREDVGAVGAMLYYPDDTVQHAGVILGMGGVASHAHRGLPRGAPGYGARATLTQTLSAVTAACMVVRKAVFDAVGGFDEALAVSYNDVDLCLRIQARGLRNVWTPFAELYHFESVSRGDARLGAARPRFLAESDLTKQRWHDLLNADPYFNPNLSLERADFGLAYPPRHARRWWER